MAPTPSGFLHLGNVFSFVYTATIAAKTGALIMLRIDDLDQQRVRNAYVQDIFDTLNFLEISWHDGPVDVRDHLANWSQTHRMEQYQKALYMLADHQAVYACNCSRSAVRAGSADGSYTGVCREKAIPLDCEDCVWRLRTYSDQEIQEILVTTGPQVTIKTYLPASMQDFVVKRREGLPAYQLASVIDDQYFGVDLIVRGADLWHSTLAQLYLAPLIGAQTFLINTFYHHPLLTEPSGAKLSKSAGATSVKFLREQGKTAADVFTLIAAMLGIEGYFKNWQELGNALKIQTGFDLLMHGTIMQFLLICLLKILFTYEPLAC